MRKFMTIAVAMLAVACSAKPHTAQTYTQAAPFVPAQSLSVAAGTFKSLHAPVRHRPVPAPVRIPRIAHRHVPVRVSRIHIRPRLYSGSHNWDALVGCEASGNWHINTGNGFYGGPQFTLQTWYSHGGVGMPQNASREFQISVAERVLADQGRGAWPNCGRFL